MGKGKTGAHEDEPGNAGQGDQLSGVLRFGRRERKDQSNLEKGKCALYGSRCKTVNSTASVRDVIMSILQNLIIQAYNEERPERPKLSFSYECEGIEKSNFPTQRKYSASLRIDSFFWANSAQLSSGKEKAFRHINSMLFGDTLASIDSAISAVFNHENELALKILEDLRTKIVR